MTKGWKQHASCRFGWLKNDIFGSSILNYTDTSEDLIWQVKMQATTSHASFTVLAWICFWAKCIAACNGFAWREGPASKIEAHRLYQNARNNEKPSLPHITLSFSDEDGGDDGVWTHDLWNEATQMFLIYFLEQATRVSTGLSVFWSTPCIHHILKQPTTKMHWFEVYVSLYWLGGYVSLWQLTALAVQLVQDCWNQRRDQT